MGTLGLVAACGALLSWTFGDYAIEQTTREIGNWKAIFFIGLGAFIGLTPFVYKDIGTALQNISDIKMLVTLSSFSLLTALLLFEALKRGKLSIIEPIFGLELTSVVILSIVIGGEKLNPIFYILSAVVFGGLILAVTNWHHLRLKKELIEKGTMLAIIGALLMGFTDFLTGQSSRALSPLLTIWFLHVSIGLFSLIYLLFKGQAGHLFRDLRRHPKTVVSLMFFDNFAWVCYGYAMVFLPISIATTITESYIALTVFLGIYLNKEKVQRHQIIGVILVVLAVLMLAYLVEY